MKTAGMKCSAFRLRAFKYAYDNQEEKAHARTLYWLKAPTSAFKFKHLKDKDQSVLVGAFNQQRTIVELGLRKLRGPSFPVVPCTSGQKPGAVISSVVPTCVRASLGGQHQEHCARSHGSAQCWCWLSLIRTLAAGTHTQPQSGHIKIIKRRHLTLNGTGTRISF